MSYRYPFGHDRYSKVLTDELQFELLQPNHGDENPAIAGANTPWGRAQLLTPDKPKFTFVSTDILPRAVPWALQLRFSLDGVTFTPQVPAGYPSPRGILFTVTRSLSFKSSAAVEQFELVAGDAQPTCGYIARQLTVTAELTDDLPFIGSPLYVQAVVCIVSSLDCDMLAPAPAPVDGFAITTTARYPAETAPDYGLAANAKRALFSISNQSASNLYVHLGAGVNITPGSEFATVIIPGSVSGGYSVENFRGEINFKFDADDATGFALVTEGNYA